MKNPKQKVIILGLILLGLFLFFNLNSALAQENGANCTLGNNTCTKQGLQLTSLLENRGLTFSLVVVAGLLDGVNPCAIGMLILLLGYLLVFAHDPDRMVKLGLIYIITIFLTYFLIGIIFSQIVYKLLAWPWYQEISHIIKYVIVILIWLAALLNIKDFFFYGKWFSLGVSKGEVPILMKLIQKVDWPTTILLGILVTLFELPCSLPLYVGAIAIMSGAFHYILTIAYLLLYNIMFVTPLLIVYAVLVKTHHIFEAKDIQERANRWMKLSMGVAQIIIGVVLLLI